MDSFWFDQENTDDTSVYRPVFTSDESDSEATDPETIHEDQSEEYKTPYEDQYSIGNNSSMENDQENNPKRIAQHFIPNSHSKYSRMLPLRHNDDTVLKYQTHTETPESLIPKNCSSATLSDSRNYQRSASHQPRYDEFTQDFSPNNSGNFHEDEMENHKYPNDEQYFQDDRFSGLPMKQENNSFDMSEYRVPASSIQRSKMRPTEQDDDNVFEFTTQNDHQDSPYLETYLSRSSEDCDWSPQHSFSQEREYSHSVQSSNSWSPMKIHEDEMHDYEMERYQDHYSQDNQYTVLNTDQEEKPFDMHRFHNLSSSVQSSRSIHSPQDDNAFKVRTKRNSQNSFNPEDYTMLPPNPENAHWDPLYLPSKQLQYAHHTPGYDIPPGNAHVDEMEVSENQYDDFYTQNNQDTVLPTDEEEYPIETSEALIPDTLIQPSRCIQRLDNRDMYETTTQFDPSESVQAEISTHNLSSLPVKQSALPYLRNTAGGREPSGHCCLWKTNEEVCLQERSSSNQLTNHIDQCHLPYRMKEYVCHWVDCAMKKKTRNEMVKHIRTHTGDRPHRCNMCQQSFANSNGLKVHKRIHTGDKPFQCTYDDCVRTFNNKWDLRKHAKTHLGFKPFSCQYENCGMSYRTARLMVNHITKMHGTYSTEATAADIFDQSSQSQPFQQVQRFTPTNTSDAYNDENFHVDGLGTN